MTILCGQLPGCPYTYGTQGHSWGSLRALHRGPTGRPHAAVLREHGTHSCSRTWKVRRGAHHIQRLLLFSSQNFQIFFCGTLMFGFGGMGNTDVLEETLLLSERWLRQGARCNSSCTYLFVGPFVSVHLHHPLTEHVERVFLVFLPVGTQPLPF